MKFDPFKWLEIEANVENEFQKGRLRLRSSQAGALYITCEGFEALAGTGDSFDLEISEPGTARLDAPEGTRLFVEVIEGTVAPAPEEECFTNIDRMAHESGSMLEVKRALRMLEIERRNTISQIRQESAMLAQQRAAMAPPLQEPQSQPAPASEAQGEVAAE